MFLALSLFTLIAIGEDSNWKFKTNTEVIYERVFHDVIRETIRNNRNFLR